MIQVVNNFIYFCSLTNYLKNIEIFVIVKIRGVVTMI
jgi:hypothetical protein